MRKLLFVLLFFIALAVSNYAYCQDDLLAIDVIDTAQKPALELGEAVQEAKEADKPDEAVKEESLQKEDPDKDFNKIKAYRELLDKRQKELEIIRLELEKSILLLKQKEAQKQIYEIDKELPQGKNGFPETSSLIHEIKEPLIEASDVKIQFLLVSNNLKEGQANIKGMPFSFKEGDCIASRLFVEEITSSSVTFRQQDNSLLKVNFGN